MENMLSQNVGLEDLCSAATETSHQDFKIISGFLNQLTATYDMQIIVEFPVRSSSIDGLIDYKSDSAMTKVVQLIGFLDFQSSYHSKFYTNTLVEDVTSIFERKYLSDMDYPSDRHGFIQSYFFRGLDPYGQLVHLITSKEVMVLSLWELMKKAEQISIKEVKKADSSFLQLKLPKARLRDGAWAFLERYGFRYGESMDRTSLPCEDLSISVLKKVLKQVEIIKSSRSGEPNFQSHEVEAVDLQSAVDQYLQGTAKSTHDAGERFGVHKDSSDSSTKACLEKMRTLLIRKGSGFSSRIVNEIGITRGIAQLITFEEREYLQELVDNKLCLTYRDGSSRYSLSEGSKGHISLRLGQVVHRRIMDGDMVFINRPPTTHKHSLQAVSVYVHDGHTVKINPLICGPLSADFDGDCIHLFYPQSLATKAEKLELFSVEKQLLSSHSGNLNLQLNCDSLFSLKTMFRAYFLDSAAAQQLAMFVSSSLPQPALWKADHSVPFWTALQIFQTALTSQFYCTGERYMISNGDVVKVDFSRDVMQSVINEEVISMFFEKGFEAVFNFFNSLQSSSINSSWELMKPPLMENILSQSVGLEDLFRDATERSHQDFKVISGFLNQLTATYDMQIVIEFPVRSSSIDGLIDYKSDSAMTKVVQIIGFLDFQSTNRLVSDMDYPSDGHGFIQSCFFRGLDPYYEQLVHSISSKEVMVLWELMKGILKCRVNFKNDMTDGRIILYFNYCGRGKFFCLLEHPSSLSPQPAVISDLISPKLLHKIIHDVSFKSAKKEPKRKSQPTKKTRVVRLECYSGQTLIHFAEIEEEIQDLSHFYRLMEINWNIRHRYPNPTAEENIGFNGYAQRFARDHLDDGYPWPMHRSLHYFYDSRFNVDLPVFFDELELILITEDAGRSFLFYGIFQDFFDDLPELHVIAGVFEGP